MTQAVVLYGVERPDGDFVALEIDPLAPWLVVVDAAHHQIHEGERFYAKQSDATLADAETIVVHVKTGAAYSHLFVEVTAALAYTLEVFENPTTSNDGTALTVLNRNRNSSKTSDTTAFHTPTASGNGTSIDGPYYVGGGAQRPGGSSRSESEIILKPNESYLIILTSRANGNSASVLADWYDEGAD